ncbi:MAG: aldehyde dehydrogenase family protein, partial [Phycisphaerae bacterium]
MLQSPLLDQARSLLGGEGAVASDRDRLRVINPATGDVLAELQAMGAEQTDAAIAAAERFLRGGSTLQQRRAWLAGVADRLMAHQSELARVITLEHGKPLKESLAEVEYAAGFFRVCADHLDHLRPHVLPGMMRRCRWTVHRRPAGVVGLITPWNFPLAMLAKKLSAAIGAGCGIVAKPASLTPLSAMALAAVAAQAGVPAGMLNVVVGPSGPIGRTLCEHPAVRLISFTGSTEVGRQLMQAVVPGMKRLALELGGNAPFIVFDDADLPAAVEGLVANKFRAGGQTCVCANRVYVHARVHEVFVDALLPRVRALKVGNGLEPDTDLGPLINREAFDKVQAHVQDAVTHGARLLAGGEAPRPAHEWG